MTRTYHVGQAITYTFPFSIWGGVMPDMDVPGEVTGVDPTGPRGGRVSLLLHMPKGPWGPAADRELVVYADDQHLKVRR